MNFRTSCKRQEQPQGIVTTTLPKRRLLAGTGVFERQVSVVEPSGLTEEPTMLPGMFHVISSLLN